MHVRQLEQIKATFDLPSDHCVGTWTFSVEDVSVGKAHMGQHECDDDPALLDIIAVGLSLDVFDIQNHDFLVNHVCITKLIVNNFS